MPSLSRGGARDRQSGRLAQPTETRTMPSAAPPRRPALRPESRMPHPCLSCGACCAAYRVSLHWSEAEPALGGVVPRDLTETVDPHRLCMRGTWAQEPRCIALEGTIGDAVRCTIYDARPSPCRELRMSWEDGTHSPQCDKARLRHGLPPLTREEVDGSR